MTERRKITSACPTCGTVAERETYDIGSGPELACSNCEWCWGADGQDLKPIAPLAFLREEPLPVAQSPDCPECGNPGTVMLRGSSQAFCHTNGCPVLCWDMSRTPAENRAAAAEVNLDE